MASRDFRELPAQLERVRRRFERWRQTRSVGTRIPESLWLAATKMARAYGVHRTASTLGIDYYRLKRRAEEDVGDASPVATEQPKIESPVTFMELPPVQSGTGECILEMEEPGGAKMRVHLKGVGTPDLAALSRSFWSGQS